MKKRSSTPAKSLGDALDELVETLGIRKKLREQDVFSLWNQAVGEQIAQAATPSRMLRGTLFVSVQSAAWRNELNMRKREIIDRLNEVLTEEIVRDIKFQ